MVLTCVTPGLTITCDAIVPASALQCSAPAEPGRMACEKRRTGRPIGHPVLLSMFRPGSFGRTTSLLRAGSWQTPECSVAYRLGRSSLSTHRPMKLAARGSVRPSLSLLVVHRRAQVSPALGIVFRRCPLISQNARRGPFASEWPFVRRGRSISTCRRCGNRAYQRPRPVGPPGRTAPSDRPSARPSDRPFRAPGGCRSGPHRAPHPSSHCRAASASTARNSPSGASNPLVPDRPRRQHYVRSNLLHTTPIASVAPNRR